MGSHAPAEAKLEASMLFEAGKVSSAKSVTMSFSYAGATSSQSYSRLAFVTLSTHCWLAG